MAATPSGEQFELRFGEQYAVVTEVGAGLRAYSAGGRELLDGYPADELEAYRKFALEVAQRVAEAHKEGGEQVSEGERAAIEKVSASLYPS